MDTRRLAFLAAATFGLPLNLGGASKPRRAAPKRSRSKYSPHIGKKERGKHKQKEA